MNGKIAFLILIIFLSFTMCLNKKDNNFNNNSNENFSFIEETPLIIDLNISGEIVFDGQIIIFNGWPPHIRMIVNDDKIIGIEENKISEGIISDFINNRITGKGLYKLKYLRNVDLPYYENPLMVFEIIEYNGIENIDNDKE